jgi:hypothetical protein
MKQQKVYGLKGPDGLVQLNLSGVPSLFATKEEADRYVAVHHSEIPVVEVELAF